MVVLDSLAVRLAGQGEGCRRGPDLQVAEAGLRDPVLHAGHPEGQPQLWHNIALQASKHHVSLIHNDSTLSSEDDCLEPSTQIHGARQAQLVFAHCKAASARRQSMCDLS